MTRKRTTVFHSEEERRIVVVLRERARLDDLKQPGAYLLAIKQDRQSEEYQNDPEAVNPPSPAYLSTLRGIRGSDPGASVPSVPDGARSTVDPDA